MTPFKMNRQLQPSDWDRARLKKILGQLNGKKVLVVGDVGVDRYTVGVVERISPEAPVPIVLVEEEKLKLGLAANVADNVRALGGRAYLTGVVGQDRSADDFRGLLRELGINDLHLIADPTRRTVLKERIVSDRQQMLRVDYESVHPLSQRVEDQVFAKVEALLREVDSVIVEDYAKGIFGRNLAPRIFELTRQSKRLCLVDPNKKTKMADYRGSDVLTPNKREAEILSGVSITNEAGLLEAGQKILKVTEAKYIVITLGKDGMAIFSGAQGECHLIPTFAREVYDVSGAGDTVIAVLALAMSADASIAEAAVLANLAAGVEVSKRGTATVSPQEILAAMESFS